MIKHNIIYIYNNNNNICGENFDIALGAWYN